MRSTRFWRRRDPMSTLNQIAHHARRRRAGWARVWGEQGKIYPLLYLAPFLLFFIVFQIYPIFQGLYVSLTRWDLATPPRFIGLANYAGLLRDTLFLTALRNTALFVALNAPHRQEQR